MQDVGCEVRGHRYADQRWVAEDPGAARDGRFGDAAVAFTWDGADFVEGVVWVGLMGVILG